MPSLAHVLHALSLSPGLLDHVDLQQLTSFITLAHHVKDAILAAQPPNHDPNVPPPVLPQHISIHISNITRIPLRFVSTIWTTTSEVIWMQPRDVCGVGEMDFKAWLGASQVKLSAQSLWPPHHLCENSRCTNFKSKLTRARDPPQRVTLFTLRHGPRATFAVHLTCTECRTTYFPNYSVQDGVRTYYGELPAVIQAAEHHYLERSLVNLFVGLMVMAWTSSTNAARIYNEYMTSPEPSTPSSHDMPTHKLNNHHVFDAFVIVSLLEDSKREGSVLRVPHTGDQRDRFACAMEARNFRIRTFGQPAASHWCTKCMRTLPGENGTMRKIHALVGDGICIGRPRCSADGCALPLPSNSHRFCNAHHHLNFVCSVTECSQATVDGRLTCSNVEHQALESNRNSRKGGMFQLAKAMQRQAVAHPDDALDAAYTADIVETADGPEVTHRSTTFIDDATVECPTKEATKLKAVFGRVRTHAEFTLNRPCGIITGRYTCFKAETLSGVHLALTQLDRLGQLPEVLFYDNGCRLYRYLNKHDPALLDKIALPVDVFHWQSKHKKTDIECSYHCNPYAFPELRTDTSGTNNKLTWYFNSSVAEQNNVWFGGYHSVVREMNHINYDFFLDEMILRRNSITLARLEPFMAGTV